MTIEAVYENGVFRPLGAVDLPENSRVQISVVSEESPTSRRPLLELAEIAGRLPGSPDRPADFAAQHDHYLYGTPKRP